jgi:hypothetical protein
VVCSVSTEFRVARQLQQLSRPPTCPAVWFGYVHASKYVLNMHFNSDKKFWEELITYFPWYDTGHIEDASNNSSIVACVFVTTETFLPSRCLTKIGGFLQSRCLATIRGYLQSRCLARTGGFLRSRCLETIRRLLPSRCLAMIGGYTDTHKHTHRQQRDLISLLLCVQNKESRLKTDMRLGSLSVFLEWNLYLKSSIFWDSGSQRGVRVPLGGKPWELKSR